MTREKAKEILISTLRDINSDDDGFEYTTEQFTEAMLIAIESLSKHSLPSDLEEAAGEYEREHTYQRYDGGGLTPEYDATLAEAFIVGADWGRKQVLQEIYDGKVKPVDKITAAWLADEQNT